jgi:predicted MFS family arabinose efflux permease
LGALLYALGLFAMSQATAPLAFTLSVGLLVGVAQSATSIAIVVGAVGRLVSEDQRSRALGITMTGTSLGQLVMLPFGQALIDAFGWQASLAIMSGITLLIVPLALGFALRAAPRGASAGQRLGEALGEASRHRGYLLLTAGFFTCGFHVTFIGTHLPSYLADQRFPGATGASALALIGLFNIAGTYVWGHLGGTYSKKRLLSLIYFGRVVVISAFMLAPKTPLTIYVFSALLGVVWLGTVTLTSGLVGQIFGVQYLSTLFGIVFLSHQAGSFLGAWLGGLVYDLVGSYGPMWYAAIVLALFATAVNWPIDERAIERPAPAGQAA